MVADALNNRGGFAELDSDLYKPYHPRYDELMRRDDTLMAAYIGPDSWAWLAQAHQYVRAHQVNVLKPETGQDSRGAAANLRAYREAGFRVEAMVLAVPAAMSNQGIVSRYYEQVLDRGHGRLTVQANADRAYTGILDLADAIDSERLADEAGVFRRGETKPRTSCALTTCSAADSGRNGRSGWMRSSGKRSRSWAGPWKQPANPAWVTTCARRWRRPMPPALPHLPARHAGGARRPPRPRRPTVARPTGRPCPTSNAKPAGSTSPPTGTPEQKPSLRPVYDRSARTGRQCRSLSTGLAAQSAESPQHARKRLWLLNDRQRPSAVHLRRSEKVDGWFAQVGWLTAEAGRSSASTCDHASGAAWRRGGRPGYLAMCRCRPRGGA